MRGISGGGGGGGEALQGPLAGRGGSGGGGGADAGGGGCSSGGRGGAEPTADGSSLIDGCGGCGGDGSNPTAGAHWFSETPVAGDEGTGRACAPLPQSPLRLAEESGGRASRCTLLPLTGSMPQSPEYEAEEGVLGRGISRGNGSSCGGSAGSFPPVTSSWPGSPALPQHPAHRQPASARVDGRSTTPRVTDMESCFPETEAASCRPESPRGPPSEALGSGASQQQLHAVSSRPASSLSQECLPSAESNQRSPYPPTINDVARSHSFLPHIPQPPPPLQCQPPSEKPVSESVRSAAAAGTVAASWPMQQAMKAQVCIWGRGVLPVFVLH